VRKEKGDFSSFCKEKERGGKKSLPGYKDVGKKKRRLRREKERFSLPPGKKKKKKEKDFHQPKQEQGEQGGGGEGKEFYPCVCKRKEGEKLSRPI